MSEEPKPIYLRLNGVPTTEPPPEDEVGYIPDLQADGVRSEGTEYMMSKTNAS
jgi:hypothetical protein